MIKTLVEFARRFLIIINWLIFGIMSFVFVGVSINSNSRMFYFGLGCLALGFLFHFLINTIISKNTSIE